MEKKLVSTIYFENCSNYYHIFYGKPDPADRIQHQIDYYEVCFVLKGQLFHKNSQECVTLEEGDCFIVPPGFLHSIKESHDNTVCFWLSFQESLIFPGYQHKNLYRLFSAIDMEADNRAEDIKMKLSPPKPEQESLKKLFDCLLYEQKFISEQESNAATLIAAIIGIIARNYFDSPAMEQKLDHINECNSIMLDCIRYIDENYMKPLTISHMSKQFAVSSSTFSTMFPKVAGVPFKQYLNRKRISSAVALCADQTLPFHKIAAMCGYLDVSTFYRNFIKYMGVSPSSFRDNMQKSEN